MPASQLLQIQRSTLIGAPRARVWKALSDIHQFCKWFAAEPVDPAAVFQPGAHILAVCTHEGPCYKQQFFMDIVDIVPEQSISWRWQPGVKLPGEDISREPLTLVEFRLESAEGGTRVTITESGFDQLSPHRRSRLFEDNDAGWKYQLGALERYCGAEA